MKKKPKISFLVPVYNAGDYLLRCLDSVLRQTLKDIEVVLVDDASTDNSARLIKKYAEEDSRIKICFHKENKGTVCTRTTAVNLATGEYIMFVDNDDVLELTAAEKLYNILSKDRNIDILGFDIVGVPPEDNHDEKLKIKYEKISKAVAVWANNNNNLSKDDDDIFTTFMLEIKPICFLWSKIYKSELLKKAFKHIKPIRAVLAEDWYIYTCIAFFARKYRYIKLPLYYYHCGNGTSTFREVSLKFFESRMKSYDVIKAIRTFLDEQKVFEKDKDIFKILEKRLIMDQFRHMKTDLVPDDYKLAVKNLCKSEHGEYVMGYLLEFYENCSDYDEIANSTSWKMTRPFRISMGLVKMILFDYTVTGSFY